MLAYHTIMSADFFSLYFQPKGTWKRHPEFALLLPRCSVFYRSWTGYKLFALLFLQVEDKSHCLIWLLLWYVFILVSKVSFSVHVTCIRLIPSSRFFTVLCAWPLYCVFSSLLQEKVRLRYRLTFALGDQPSTEVGEVDQFPPVEQWGNLWPRGISNGLEWMWSRRGIRGIQQWYLALFTCPLHM